MISGNLDYVLVHLLSICTFYDDSSSTRKERGREVLLKYIIINFSLAAQLAADKLLESNSKKKPKGSFPKVFPQAPPPSAAPSASQWPSLATGSTVYTPPPPPGLGPSGWGLVPAATSTVSIKRLIIIRGLPGSGKSTLAK